MTLEVTKVDIKSGKEKEKSVEKKKNPYDCRKITLEFSKMNSMSVEKKENAFKNREVLFPKIITLYKEKERSF
jgi:hypothetical protein